jgi:hypothetical protein
MIGFREGEDQYMTAALREATVKASGSRRHAYSAPHLVHYGPLRSLTTAGTRGDAEPQPGVNQNRRL